MNKYTIEKLKCIYLKDLIIDNKSYFIIKGVNELVVLKKSVELHIIKCNKCSLFNPVRCTCTAYVRWSRSQFGTLCSLSRNKPADNLGYYLSHVRSIKLDKLNLIDASWVISKKL